jgi:hypothetical protein
MSIALCNEPGEDDQTAFGSVTGNGTWLGRLAYSGLQLDAAE